MLCYLQRHHEPKYDSKLTHLWSQNRSSDPNWTMILKTDSLAKIEYNKLHHFLLNTISNSNVKLVVSCEFVLIELTFSLDVELTG